jgi:hypothetical protein
MRWFELHIDGSLKAWAQGELSPARASRLLRHAHDCSRCGKRYERWVQPHRAFESGDLDLPSFAERAGLEDAGLEAALAAAAPASRWSSWPLLLMVAGAVAVACLLVVRMLPQEPEWQVQGEGRTALTGHIPPVSGRTAPTGYIPPVSGRASVAPAAVLRVFCAVPGKALRELNAGQTCPPRARLAFAVGAEAPLSRVSVQLRDVGGQAPGSLRPLAEWPGEEGLVQEVNEKEILLMLQKLERASRERVSGDQAKESPTHIPAQRKGNPPDTRRPRVVMLTWDESLVGPTPITGRPGEEVPLEQTIPLPDKPGIVEVMATFTTSPDAIPATMPATDHELATVVERRQLVRVQETP